MPVTESVRDADVRTQIHPYTNLSLHQEAGPMVITRGAIGDWLDPMITGAERALELLAVTEAQALEAYAVSTDVNSVENNNPSLLEPVKAEPEQHHDQETLI